VLACYIGLPFLERASGFFREGIRSSDVASATTGCGASVSHAQYFIVQIVADSGLISVRDDLAAVWSSVRLKRLVRRAAVARAIDGQGHL